MATLAVAGLLAVVVLAGTPAVADDGSDTAAPTLADGERYNVTAIRVTVADDQNVDESSVSASDFTLSEGDVVGVQANESGSNATVTLFLDDRLHANDVTVSVAEDGEIADDAGNELTEGSVSVTGMDSYIPRLRRYEVERINGTDGRIVVSTNEPLAAMELAIDGPTTAKLNESDVRAVDGDYAATYAVDYHFPENGEYRVVLESITDRAGLVANYSETTAFVRDADAPTAAVDGPRHVDAGDRGRFDGARSTDNVGVARYDWTVDGPVDGTATGDGERFEPSFAEPGTYEVTLTVADSRGNEATTNRSVTVHDAPAKEGVTVSPGNGSRVNATIADGRTSDRIRVADAYGRLVGDGNVTLRSLTVTLPANETAAIDVTGNGTAPSFEAATGRTALSTYEVAHGNVTLGDPTFRFTVSPARLGRAGVSYADVALYRDDGDWTELETRVVRATKDAVVYEATAPGLSTFVVGTTAAGNGSYGVDEATEARDARAAIRVTDATLASEPVDDGAFAVVDATLANEGGRDGTYVAGLTIGPDVVTTKRVTVPAGERRRVQFVRRTARSGTVAVNGTVAGELPTAAATPSTSGTADAGNGTATEGDGGSGLPVPNPLSLWPSGTIGAVVSAVLGTVVGVYGVLKALAIYLGY